MRHFTVSPSEWNFSYRWCRKCWWRRLRKVYSPFEKLPPVFQYVDLAMKTAPDDQESATVQHGVSIEVLKALGVPAVRFLDVEKVLSTPIEFPEWDVALVISGKLDRLVLLEDGTAGICDHKMVKVNEYKAGEYAPQLHSYRRCLEFPAKGKARKITRLGLTCWDPTVLIGGFTVSMKGEGVLPAAVKGALTWLEVPIDDERFDALLREAAQVAASLEPPESGQNCELCAFLGEATRFESDIRALALSRALEEVTYVGAEKGLSFDREECPNYKAWLKNRPSR